MFADRIDAGERLAQTLAGVGSFPSGPAGSMLVLGIPRGGVVVGRVVADRLNAPLDVVITRKLGAPSNAELAIGAVAFDGTTVLDASLIQALGARQRYVDGEIARQRDEIARRLLAYRGSAEEPDPSGRVCLVVDDGLATGATAEAAVRSLLHRGASRVVLAVPVASQQGLQRIRGCTPDIVCLGAPDDFTAVGQWYREFPQVSDDEVLAALRGSAEGITSPR